MGMVELRRVSNSRSKNLKVEIFKDAQGIELI
jgi:hypothetical protein